MKLEARLAYDVGMHNGDDSAYYLAKGFRVIGIDANPEFCRHCEARFREEIASGQMKIINTGVGATFGEAMFHISDRESQISTFAAPHGPPEEWRSLVVSVRPLSSIFAEHGLPDFAKIDVEHYDHIVLEDLRAHAMRPAYISAEAHTRATYDALVKLGYEQFKLSYGESVPVLYGDHPIATLDGQMLRYQFQPYSSGPFGDDVPGDWMTPAETMRQLDRFGFGWVDIQAKLNPYSS